METKQNPVGQLESIGMNSIKCLNEQGSNLNEQALLRLSSALEGISIAKNIVLMDKTLAVYEKLLIKHLKGDDFLFEDFLAAIEEACTQKLFNRIDYADFYQLAKAKHDKRKSDKWNAEKDAQRLLIIQDSEKQKKWQSEQRNKGAISLNEMIRRYPNDPDLKALRAVIERAEKSNENPRKPVR